MKLWRISGFDEGPHWDAAFVWAETADEAKTVLAVRLGIDAGEHPATVWSPEKDTGGQFGWRVSEVDPAGDRVPFLLGAGCR